MAEQTEQRAGECADGSDWPTREQQHVIDVAAAHGPVRVERTDGDGVRLTTAAFVADVSPDGVRSRVAGEARLDYDALTDARFALKAYASRLRGVGGDLRGYDAVRLGIAAADCVAAEDAIFRALNTLSSYADDVRAGQAIQDWSDRMDVRSNGDA